jgi:C1A family cysteine protease
MVTPVKNQGMCGSCYAFAAIAHFESRLLMAGAGVFDLSENNVKECEWFGSSCSGGNDWIVTNYLSTKGTVLESCDPYVASNVSCTQGCPYQHNILDWRAISFSQVPSVEILKSYIQAYGPIYATMYAGKGDAWSTEFQSYNGSYTLYHAGTEAPNHAVLIVGWDDNLTHAGGQGAWIVKNSWGTSWGGTCGYGASRGYFTIAYGSASIGAYSSFIYQWQDVDPAGDVLYHDEGGYTGSLGYMSTTAWGLCKFVPVKDWSLERVEFWTVDATTDVDVYIYDTFNGSTVSNLLASKLNSSFALPGYHSVSLPAPLHIAEGNDIYAVIKVTNSSGKYPIVYDTVGPQLAGYSYISSTGAYFSQFTNGDIGIRLRVTGVVSCGEIQERPVIAHIMDAPADDGGRVDLAWTRSTHDAEAAPPSVRIYRIWRKRPDATPGGTYPTQPIHETGNGPRIEGPYEYGPSGSAWELVGSVPASGQCCYSFTATTHGDVEGADTSWTYFYVSAHTGQPGVHYDSEIQRGFSVNNSAQSNPPDNDPDARDIAADLHATPAVSLSRPEPNPAIDGFNLRFEIRRPGLVQLGIYDVTGRQITVLADGYLAAGPYVERWDADRRSGLAAGLYFARLACDDEVHTVKLILAR